MWYTDFIVVIIIVIIIIGFLKVNLKLSNLIPTFLKRLCSRVAPRVSESRVRCLSVCIKVFNISLSAAPGLAD